MAVLSRSSNNWIFSLQVLCLSIAVLSLAFVLKLSLPVILEFIVAEVPQLWISMNSWLTPPYLYIVINGIIITIAASSRFHNQHNYNKIHDDDQMELLVSPSVKIQSDANPDFFVSSSSAKEADFVMLNNPVEIKPEFEGIISDYYDDADDFVKNPVMVSMPDSEKFEPEVYGQTEGDFPEVKTMISATGGGGDEENDFADSKSMLTPNRTDSMEIPSDYSFSEEKPPVSARLFSHRRTVKGSNEAGKVLRSVAKPKRNDTLESTWKTITEGRSMPLARHLKKSDTWETHNTGPQVSSSSSSSSTSMKVRKSETFKDGKNQTASSSSSTLRGSVRLKKEPSLSQEELNRRVEAFIKKFNEEMRLQRQESLNQYREMVTRGCV
ncbi:Protein of unknown function DUF761 [Macleaya cordata]|uniref:DUF4408 domain-containing protein n=1 Tax=Macleaya cordata TaxID=56857 RepID=A0A200RBW7_MACCD|nr:Protein of unknown function DUF761 [Macleaya cordata]